MKILLKIIAADLIKIEQVSLFFLEKKMIFKFLIVKNNIIIYNYSNKICKDFINYVILYIDIDYIYDILNYLYKFDNNIYMFYQIY